MGRFAPFCEGLTPIGRFDALRIVHQRFEALSAHTRSTVGIHTWDMLEREREKEEESETRKERERRKRERA